MYLLSIHQSTGLNKNTDLKICVCLCVCVSIQFGLAVKSMYSVVKLAGLCPSSATYYLRDFGQVTQLKLSFLIYKMGGTTITTVMMVPTSLSFWITQMR